MRLTILTLLILALTDIAEAGEIDRIEPPFWYQGFEHDELQVLVYGQDIGSSQIRIDDQRVRINRIERVENKNYLFLYLDLSRFSQPDVFDIFFDNGNVRSKHAYELRLKNSDPDHTKGFSTADAIYLITPDRFANGDTTNDSVIGLSDRLNRNDDYGRHGGDLAGIKRSLDYITNLGFTAIWLNPVLENSMPEASYHGYATTDYYRVDPRFGSNEEYRDLVAAARQKGLGVIMDMITNHCGSEHWWAHDLPTSDWFNFQGDYHRTNSAKATLLDPYASEYDKKIYLDGWYVPAMPDLNQRNPLLADYLIQNAIWWTEYLGLSGIRLDTYAFSDKDFLNEWARRILVEFPQFNITGEETVEHPSLLSYWQRGKQNHDGFTPHLPSLLDFPLFHAMNESLTKEVAWWDSPWSRAYSILAADYEYADPNNLVIFPDNHDQSRIYTKVGENDALFTMAMAYFLTMRGIPQIYYGTEVLMSHPKDDGNHGQIRAEFPGGWDDHDRNAFTGEGLSARQLKAQALLRKLLNWRRDKSVIQNGALMQYTPMHYVYAFFRYDEMDTVMVIFNRGEEPATVDMSRFHERTRNHRFATDIISDKRLDITTSLQLEPMSTLILEFE